jgi:transcription-repair coupling factor (superfamily II helicase)
VPASTAVNRLAPPEFLAAYTFEFKKGQKLDADKFRSQVTLAGYATSRRSFRPANIRSAAA